MDQQLDFAPCGYFSISDTGIIHSANQTFATMLAYERDELIGKHIESFMSMTNKLFFHTYFYPYMQLYGHVNEIYLSLQSSGRLDVPVLLNGVRQTRDGETFMDCVIVEMRRRLEHEKDVLATKQRLEHLVQETNETNHKLELLHQEYETKQRELMSVNLQLETLALTDPLTGLKNRRFFNESLLSHLSKFHRSGELFSIALIDIDRFKSINDTYGHPVGDLVLTDLARLLNTSSRETDVTARFGGEEFVILLAGADESQAVHVAERLRAAIEAATLGNLNITASIGVATITLEDTDDRLINKADQALYESKASGRNRVTHAMDLKAAE
ncbi:PAS domain S-box-containing protein/diguanylate cyclase (GGDEF)-like protein [Paenibacillus cellulosilyticus]|uniref:PAS domain S-box-containing protein/diguanylate cyclase (GGDEF)-like protein n=1 Tax=Paenibacillus cellulosilyticus TaxID=375489 RepID=A0A2V2YZ03_9BACL|nr:sensor domain-containing diguanylate cyclase [Paenibacillus cellulosilyticus]PWW05094.1 PAS domain S-box-containing protein/diguanylate cyclase (GGDEF)-like protein [Paenibacillus cellulosilyticus]QKS48646.1 sensor domain-containing diguanylate cyclase [Paenibacillus cellulosilyticus]